MKKTIRNATFALLPIMALGSIALSACTKSFEPPADTLVVALGAQPLTLDPRFATDATGVRVASLIFSGFVRVGDKFTILPDAAERWSLDGRTYSFFLRPDLRFHNGRPLTKEDLIFTWNFYRSAASPHASSLKVVDSVDIAERSGQLIMHVKLKRRAPSFLMNELPAVKILPALEIAAAGADFNQVLIGTGPFSFVRQNLNEIRLKGVTAKTPNLVFKVIRDDFTRYQKMLKGEVDVAQNEIPPEKVAEFQARPRDFQVHTYPGLNMTYLLINLRHPVLAKLDTRLAMAHAIDRSEIIRHKLLGLASEATSILTPENPYFDQQLKNPEFNLEKARAALKDVGATLTLKTSNTPGAIDGGRVLAHQLARSGLIIRHESHEWATYYDDIKKGNFQLATMKWVGTVDPEIYRSAFHSSEVPPGRNRGQYVNPAVDRLLDQGLAEEAIERRKTIFHEVQRRVHADLPIIPLWYDTQVAIAHRRVRDYIPVMTGDYWPFTKAHKDR